MATVKKDSKPTDTVFGNHFKSLTGHAPFPWQSELFKRFSQGMIPESCSLPTGLGKTNVIAVWLIALAQGGRLPRRLVYVVNRRTVVDQTTTEVERLRANFPKLGVDDFRTLAISTLRGQFADNREWSADPSMPAVICGTVDMIGSRLLFSGYRTGFRSRPLHAAFLGQDVLLVHDEAHLEPAFQKLVEAIQHEQHVGEGSTALPWPKLRIMALSATLRGENPKTDDSGLTLRPTDHQNLIVKKRVRAPKDLRLHSCQDEKKGLVECMAEQALQHKGSGDGVLIFVRRVSDVDEIVRKLTARQIGVGSDHVAMLTGTMRGFERDQLVRSPVFVRFLPAADRPADIKPAEGSVFLVCTSAGEVGVNLSADHMVCDLSTFESMAQRLGRVNRFGDRKDTRVDVVYPETFSDKDGLTPARRATLDLLKALNGDASPWALDQLDVAARRSAFAPEPVIPPTSDILFDTWALTTIRGPLPGRPSVEPYLHGIADWQPPETHVAWRQEVEVVTGGLLRRYRPEDLLDEYELKPRELLRDRTDRVFSMLKALAGRDSNKPAWIKGTDAVVEVTLKQLADGPQDRIAGCTVLLPPSAGGLLHGMLDAKSEQAEDVADALVPDDARADTESRARVYSDDPDYDTKTAGMRRILSIEVDDTEGGDEPRRWDWLESIPHEGGSSAQRPVDLDTHVGDVEQQAREIAARLALPDDLAQAIVCAARLHDSGKQRERFQAILGNHDYPKVRLAKSGRGGARFQEPFRHEFASLLDARKDAEFNRLNPDIQDLVLHLIAAHHGRARPHFGQSEAFDPDHSTLEAEGVALEVPRRFARLQRRYGRWGLAYLESLLRAADWAASASPSAFADGQEADA